MLQRPILQLLAGLLTFLCFSPSLLQAQESEEKCEESAYFIDSIFVEIEDRHKMVMIASSREQFYTFTNLNSRLQIAAQQIENIKKQAPDRFQTVHLTLDERIQPNLFSIEPGEKIAGRTYQLKESSTVPIKTIPDTLTLLLADGQRAIFYLEGIDHLQDLANIDIDGQLGPVFESIKTNKHAFGSRNPIKATYLVKNKSISEMKDEHFGRDLIELTFAPGISTIRGHQVLDFTPRVSLIFPNKTNTVKHMFSVKAPFYYFYEGGLDAVSTQRVNTFVDLEYGLSLSNGNDDNTWMKVSAGYLVNKNGSYFNSNTYKFGFTINHRRTRSFSVTPQVFLYDSFKKAYPGLRIGFNL